MSPVLTALLIPFLGTALGSAFVFFMKREMPPMLQKILLGFASGVMVAASVWSLIIPSIEELVPEYSQGKHSNIGTIGFALGFVLMMVLDVVLG